MRDSNPALPRLELATKQSRWLRGARNRLWRAASILRRNNIVDLGCGWGFCSAELIERTRATVLSIDADRAPLGNFVTNGRPADQARLHRIQARAEYLPLADASVDLIFTQLAFLWFHDPGAAVAEAHRVLNRGGAVAAIEPDYGGLVEYPDEIQTRDMWISGTQRAGGQPFIGRQLPALLRTRGFDVQIQLVDRIKEPDPARFDLLAGLPLENDQQRRLDEIRATQERLNNQCLVHLPFFLILAEKQ